ncbi:MAG TPA: S8 family serine peptidase [Thermomicrobiales bacterium]
MRRLAPWIAVIILCLLLPPSVPAPTMVAIAPPPPPGAVGEYVVLYAAGVTPSAARAAITAAGGRIVRENTAIGLATVRTTRHDGFFLRAVRRDPALAGATLNVPLGRVPVSALDERGTAEGMREVEPGMQPHDGGANGGPQTGSDPLGALQWDMRAIGATADGAHATQAGDSRVLVGVIDSGIDGNHPDIAPNFDRELSRNFVTDRPDLDGACTYASCIDPPDEDGNGHGTHVAGTIAAARNDLGIVGVAPNVTLVNLRAGQDSGIFLLQPTVDALTYAGDVGINVVNMSYYIDPWLYNCPANPADNEEAQQAQRMTLEATQRALDYARAHGVVLVSAAGNGHTDLDHATVDTTSPNFPSGATYRREIDRTCLSMPTDGRGVISVTATGPSGRKAYYSDYGLEHADLAAPGGDSLDYYGTAQYQPTKNRILSTYPKALLLASGEIDAQGQVTARGQSVVRDCRAEVCAYYRYLEGTSMAAPHVTGVAALIVSQYGTLGRENLESLRLSPARVERLLELSATPRPCPAQNPFVYPGLSANAAASYTANCEGTTERNGFYGVGLVDAKRAVGR